MGVIVGTHGLGHPSFGVEKEKEEKKEAWCPNMINTLWNPISGDNNSLDDVMMEEKLLGTIGVTRGKKPIGRRGLFSGKGRPARGHRRRQEGTCRDGAAGLAGGL